MKWFRLYREVLNDPKVQLLPVTTKWRWVELLCLASETKGKLPAISHIAYQTRVSVTDAQALIDELILAGLVDILPDKSLVMHNWDARQYQSDGSKERVRKHRAKKAAECNGDVTVTVTAPDQTRADTDSDTELAPSPPAPVARDLEQVFQIELKKGRVVGSGSKNAEVCDLTLKRAEQFGLHVDEIMAEARDGKPDNLDAYFQGICRRRLKLILPGISDDTLRAAFKRDETAYALVQNALVNA